MGGICSCSYCVGCRRKSKAELGELGVGTGELGSGEITWVVCYLSKILCYLIIVPNNSTFLCRKNWYEVVLQLIGQISLMAGYAASATDLINFFPPNLKDSFQRTPETTTPIGTFLVTALQLMTACCSKQVGCWMLNCFHKSREDYSSEESYQVRELFVCVIVSLNLIQ